MDNFNLRDYLYNNKLLNEGVSQWLIDSFIDGVESQDNWNLYAKEGTEEYEELLTAAEVTIEGTDSGDTTPEELINAAQEYAFANLNENYTTEVRDAWPTLSDDDRIDLLTSVWDDPDEAEKHFEKDFADLPEVAKANMRMDMLREGNDNPFEYERGIVHKVIRQAIEDMSSNTALGTREYIDEIINTLEELKVTDF